MQAYSGRCFFHLIICWAKKSKEYFMNVRTVMESDYGRVINVLIEWWEGRDLRSKVNEDLFRHFTNTSFIVEEENGELVAFILGYFSQTHKNEAYINWVGVHPNFRDKGIGRMLYDKFEELARENGKTCITCYTSIGNKKSMEWHKHMGFSVREERDRYYFTKQI